MSYSKATREQAVDFMAGYPGFGEMRHYADSLGTEQVSFSWRTMPPGTGGRGSYGHRHPGQEEIYFVIRGRRRSRSATTSSRPARRRRCGCRVRPSTRSQRHRSRCRAADLLRPASPIRRAKGRRTSGPRGRTGRDSATPRSARLDAETPNPDRHLEFAARQLADPRVARWHGGSRTRTEVAQPLSAQAEQEAEISLLPLVVAGARRRRARRLRRPQPRSDRRRASGRGRLVDRARALGRGSGPGGGPGRAELGVRARGPRADRLVRPGGQPAGRSG